MDRLAQIDNSRVISLNSSQTKEEEISGYKPIHNEIEINSNINSLLLKIDASHNPIINNSIKDNLSLLSSKIDSILDLFEKNKIELEKSNEIASNKTDFLSIMSHEIRTPLNAIIGNILVLNQEKHYPHQEDSINTLKIASENLLNLINDVLDYNKIENGSYMIHKSNIPIRTLLSNIKSTYTLKASEKNNRLLFDIDKSIPEVLIGDDYALIQILNNLISNALKFTANGEIKVKLDLISKKENQVKVKFVVSDNGIGISEENLHNIFDKFTQANSSIKRDFGGSGLGLTIIKKLIELNNSQIYVNSEEGIGTTFEFEMTYEYLTKPEENNVVVKEIKDLNNLKILIADDIDFNLIFAKKIIEKWNAEVVFAKNGAEAIKIMQNENIDFVLMDIHMPLLNGIQASKKIRELNFKTPIVALTATYDLEMSTEILEAGMNDYISKPFNPEKLYNIIEKHTSI